MPLVTAGSLIDSRPPAAAYESPHTLVARDICNQKSGIKLARGVDENIIPWPASDRQLLETSDSGAFWFCGFDEHQDASGWPYRPSPSNP
ncbi:MAG: hypothetical protein JO249_25600 [Acidobacteria bacterium]|nr:hypothetical protein [Acidobacteriota bacterium]